MKVLIARFACDESGATAVEYGLIAAAMSAARRRFSRCGGNDQIGCSRAQFCCEWLFEQRFD
jgi:hypothetical protein